MPGRAALRAGGPCGRSAGPRASGCGPKVPSVEPGLPRSATTSRAATMRRRRRERRRWCSRGEAHAVAHHGPAGGRRREVAERQRAISEVPGCLARLEGHASLRCSSSCSRTRPANATEILVFCSGMAPAIAFGGYSRSAAGGSAHAHRVPQLAGLLGAHQRRPRHRNDAVRVRPFCLGFRNRPYVHFAAGGRRSVSPASWVQAPFRRLAAPAN